MKRILTSFAAISLAFAVASPAALAAKKDDRMAARKASCEKQADAKKFGIHFLKKRAFVKKCMGEKTA